MTTADHRDDAPEPELYGDEHEPIEVAFHRNVTAPILEGVPLA